ncbi:MAG: porin [Succinivibrio sp.]|nr:porin [Succinivibrio sp.]MDY5903574.1 porin [Succinivibrio sp.]
MKKSQILKTALALGLVLATASDVANAAAVYSKDGTSLNVNGRIRARFSNGDAKTTLGAAGNGDSTLKNNARFGVDGQTKVNDNLTAFFYAQWDTSDSNDRDSFSARDQYVGADFGQFGKVTAGRFLSPVYNVLAGTDVHFDFTGNHLGDNNRRGGQLKYTFAASGFEANVAYQTAIDGIKVASAEQKKFDVDSGYSASVGYTFDNVVFGPLALKLGYEYFKGQTGDDLVTKDDNKTLSNNAQYDNLGIFAAGITWGTYAAGPYAALSYSKSDYNTIKKEQDFKIEAFESVFGYGFDNGLYADIGYVWQQYSPDDLKTNKKLSTGGIQAVAGWKLAPNFVVDVESYFNLSSDGEKTREATTDEKGYYKAAYSKDQKALSVNAVYFL